MPDDLADLVAKAVAGDMAAYAALVDRHSGLVWSVIRSYRLSRSDGEDAAQGVWLALVQHLGQLREVDRLPGWIATTTRRECLAVLRRSSKVSHSPASILDKMIAANAEPDRRLLVSERAQAVTEAFGELDTRCRELLSLLGTDPPLGYNDVSDLLGMPVGAIGPTRTRCLEKIRRHRAIRRLDFTWTLSWIDVMSNPQNPSPGPTPLSSFDHLSDEDWLAHLNDDSIAPRLIEQALSAVQPPPGWLHTAAMTAWQTRDLDSQLAELVSEESATAGSRDTDVADRIVTFAATGWSLELTVRTDSVGATLDGVITGVVPDSASWEDPAGNSEPVRVDQAGRFVVSPEGTSRGRLRITGVSGATVTPWITLG
jgi:RNA polymerase sigma factor (sigma-70 family)